MCSNTGGANWLNRWVLFLGNSPHPSTPDEDDSQAELLIAEDKLSPEDDGQVMPRYVNKREKKMCAPVFELISSQYLCIVFQVQLFILLV